MKIELKKFDMSSIADDKVVVMIGKRGTGKSTNILSLLYHHRDIPVGTVLSATESANSFYSHIVPSLFIHDEYDPAVIDSFLNRQKKVIKLHNRPGGKAIDPRAFLVLDDCLFDNRWINDKNIKYLFMNGRHLKVFFVIALQYALGIPPILRTNIDYVFILRENIVANRKRIYDHYAGMFPSFETFCTVLDQTTENYECLVINNNAKSNRLEDQIFWYKADTPPEDFRLGAPEFWNLHNECYNRNLDDDDEQPFDAHALKKKRTPSISVRKSHF